MKFSRVIIAVAIFSMFRLSVLGSEAMECRTALAKLTSIDIQLTELAGTFDKSVDQVKSDYEKIFDIVFEEQWPMAAILFGLYLPVRFARDFVGFHSYAYDHYSNFAGTFIAVFFAWSAARKYLSRPSSGMLSITGASFANSYELIGLHPDPVDFFFGVGGGALGYFAGLELEQRAIKKLRQSYQVERLEAGNGQE